MDIFSLIHSVNIGIWSLLIGKPVIVPSSETPIKKLEKFSCNIFYQIEFINICKRNKIFFEILIKIV